MSITTENTFESALVQSLIEQGGYTEGDAPNYSPDLGMFKYEVIRFLQEFRTPAGGIIGRLQHLELIPFSIGNGFREKIDLFG